MAGVKGKSGGVRAGAGRKPAAKQQPAPIPPTDMLTLLQNVALGKTEATPLQVRAAIAAVQYTHTKRSDGGKKDAAEERAKKVAGRFGARPAPLKLVSRG